MKRDLGEVREALETVAGAMAGMMPRGEIEERLRQERRERYRAIMAFAAAVAVLLMFIFATLAQLGRLQEIAEQNRDIAGANAELLTTVECVLVAASTYPAGSPEQQAAYGECIANGGTP